MLAKYGTIFRKIRLNKKLTLSEVAGSITSSSFLSKFERNESSISIDLFLPLLDNMNIKFDEFAIIAQINPSKNFYTQLTHIAQLHEKNDLDGLLKIRAAEIALFTETDTSYHQHLAIIAASAIADATNTLLDHGTILYITDYLVGIAPWNQYELAIFASVVMHLPLVAQETLINELFKQATESRLPAQNIDLIGNSIINILIAHIDNQSYAIANKLMAQLNQLTPVLGGTSWEILVRLAFLRGILLICNTQRAAGLIIAQQAIATMRLINKTDLANQHSQYLAKILAL